MRTGISLPGDHPIPLHKPFHKHANLASHLHSPLSSGKPNPHWPQKKDKKYLYLWDAGAEKLKIL
jgi:hypothetical protein